MSASIFHLSIRVPWHDSAWDGCVCHDPKVNTSCMVLPRIRQTRDDDKEVSVAGQSLADVPEQQWPACIAERGSFMAPFAIQRTLTQPYSKHSEHHKHIQPYDKRYPPYSAPAVPFSWMLRETAWIYAESWGLDVDSQREPTTPEWLKNTPWVQHHDNQRAMLEGFFNFIEPHQSLCFFYAKQTPLAEDERRVIIGVGFVQSVGELCEFPYNPPGNVRAYVWERTIEHSIRPEGKNGFLLPYHAILQRAAEDPTINPADYVAFAPEYYTLDFSYGSEHVSHDSAIASLLACKDALEKARSIVDEPCDAALAWIDARLNELWLLRGPFPGLGSVLTAFGVEYGAFLAYEITKDLDDNDDPWPHVDRAFQKPDTLPKLLRGNVFSLKPTWNLIKTRKPERLALLKLLARMNLTSDQATRLFKQEERKKAGIHGDDKDFLENPYLLYERDRFSRDPLSIWVVDRGVYPREIIAEHHPLPEPSAMQSGLDPRRIRALVVATLERAAIDGHTLLPRDTIVQTINEHPLDPPCPVYGDILEAHEAFIADPLRILTMDDKSQSYQVERFVTIGTLIRTTVEKRMKGKRHTITADWRTLLDATLKKDNLPAETNNHAETRSEKEKQARTEKAAALAELAAARFAVLVGPAGTGKTTVLKVLCNHPQIQHGGVVLLAPTGKARVRMETTIGLPALTLAQFLFRYDRYNGETGAYMVLADSSKRVEVGKTIIVDEASMLTEEQLGALLDTIQGYDRLILVGDPHQLPPIGAGRPFYDIVQRLAPENTTPSFPCVFSCYAELTIPRRQAAEGIPDEELYDMRFAEWFSGRPIPPGEDDIFARVASHAHTRIRLATWEQEEELPKLLKDILEEVVLEDNTKAFEETLGGAENNGVYYFNRDSAELAENWQILSPVRAGVPGVREINRLVQRAYRSDTLEWARKQKRKRYPKDQAAVTEPQGDEEIVYGDKVMNLSNLKREYVYPKDGALQYIANGEIGMVVGELKKRGQATKPWRTRVAFSSQPGYSYDYTSKDFGDEGTLLELAYAITIHKSQGSEFDTCLIVIPNPCRLLSRELLYTALTRHKSRVVLLLQGNINDLRCYASDEYSVIARRLTNLFEQPKPKLIKIGDSRREWLFDERLIHRSARGEAMRSKSEIIIANALYAAGISYTYEQSLEGSDGHVRYPDFTIEDSDSGITYYWEHLGMLTDAAYKQRWEQKRNWYSEQGITEEGGPNGTLLVTEDDEHGGIDSQRIAAIIQEHFAS